MVMPAPPRPAGPRPSPTGLLALLVVVGVVVGTWWLSGGDPGTPTSRAPLASDPAASSAPASPSTEAEADAATGDVDPDTGLRWVELADLPVEAEDTLDLIDRGGPFPYSQDGATFQNREGILPDEYLGYYREFTVETPGSDDRGARRIVTGAPGEYFWTEDHYDSFERIVR